MKSLKITLLLAALLSLIIACDSPETTTTEATTTQEPVQQETAEPTVEKPAPAVEKQDDRTTLEGFWAAVQIAVANKDTEALKLLGAHRSGAKWLAEDHYAPLVTAIKATDFEESTRQENGKQMYEYMMSMNYPEEELVNGEQPATTIFLWKKEDGNFEIFDLFEAG
ncbi:MAG: Unknown protein [uncultured Aureispira sp.]|uniref:DUF4878 domain-containing protein n=1 Tax=uncultured Aureispira sp. TaxID=1331704 RepID=A0A6S6TQ87_9BACT|nr:MAG: Unknown protein [uncultured Aureispira sp.]